MLPSNVAARPEHAASKTAVWWDMNDCPVPDGYDAGQVRPSIEGALKDLGYNGPVTINAYGDLKQTFEQVLEGLSSTGVTVQHTAKELRCSYMYSDLMEWREHNPPPATIMLISDQVEDVFSFALCREQQKKHGYNLVLAFTRIDRRFSILDTNAKWLWGSLLLTVTDSKTPPREVESAILHCRSCGFGTKTLAKFTKHISGEEHAQKETNISRSTRPTVGPEYEKSQIRRIPRNYSAPPEYATSKTAVWWDMRHCPLPFGYEAGLVRPSIEGALKSLGHNGPVTITAYGDIKRTPEQVLRGLSSTGVAVQHTIKAKRCSLMYGDMLAWQSDNLPPATIMVISDDVEKKFFCLCRLLQRCGGYKLVLAYASAPTKSSVLVTCAEWLWGSLLRTGSQTPRQVLCQRGGESAMFHCKSCLFDGESLEIFSEHLSGEEHAQRESIINPSLRPRAAEYKVKKSPKKKRNCRGGRKEKLFQK